MFYRIADFQPGGDVNYFGQKEIQLFETYQEGENILYYIQLSAQISADQSSQDNFKQEFETKLSKYLEKYNLTVSDYTISYTTSEGKTDILGLSSKSVTIEKENIIYRVTPNFKIEVPFELSSSNNVFE